MNLSGKKLQSFWRRVDKTPSSGCWEWTGGLSVKGYGQLMVKGRLVLAHRVSYEMHHGTAPGSLFCCHRCDNPRCVNPSHLFLGTPRDNARDMVSKNRQARGVDIGKSKLTPGQVLAIRRRYTGRGGETLKEIAADYGVHFSLISLIARGTIWNHLTA